MKSILQSIRNSKLRHAVSSSYRKVQRQKALLEQYKYIERQLIAQRSRLFELIEVFGRASHYCEPEDLIAVMNEVRNTDTQFYQDIYALLVSKCKRNGFFVEFGACDGLIISNSLLLEKTFGWRGILSEPAKEWHEELRRNRSCAIETRCVWSESGKTIPFYEAENNLSSSVESSHMQISRRPVYDVETISLEDLLKTHNAPKYIDLLSVDTEGSEFEILKAFPFSDYEFGLACIEHHTSEEEERISSLMSRNGYKQVLRHVSGFDGFYVKKDCQL